MSTQGGEATPSDFNEDGDMLHQAAPPHEGEQSPTGNFPSFGFSPPDPRAQDAPTDRALQAISGQISALATDVRALVGAVVQLVETKNPTPQAPTESPRDDDELKGLVVLRHRHQGA